MATILLIDDEPAVRELLSDFLTRSGHLVTGAANGAEGEALYKSRSFDLVIMDILMPQQGGLETILRLKSRYPDIRLIAISGGCMLPAESYLSLVRPLGVDECLSKPFELSELIDSVNRLLNRAVGEETAAVMR